MDCTHEMAFLLTHNDPYPLKENTPSTTTRFTPGPAAFAEPIAIDFFLPPYGESL